MVSETMTMFGRIERIDTTAGHGFINTGIDELGVVRFACQRGENYRIGQTVSFDIAWHESKPYARNVQIRDERNVSAHNTEDRDKWYDEGERLEQAFLERFDGKLPFGLRINPEKEYDPSVIDFIEGDGSQYADLKTQNTPFFTADRKNKQLDPRFTVTFNRKDYLRYKKLYPNCRIYFWVNWTQTEWNNFHVEPLEGVWVARFADMQEAIESGRVTLHPYKYRVNDEHNAKDSYLFDLRSDIFTRLDLGDKAEAPVRELSDVEYAEYEGWAYRYKDKLEFNFEVQYHEAGIIYIKIFEAGDKVIGLVYANGGTAGWEFNGKNRLEHAYDVIANHENEYVRSAIASFWLPTSFEIAQCKRSGPAPYRILKRLAKDESAIVRASVTWSQGITREILDMLATDSEEMVREAVASDPLTSKATLEMLSRDESLSVLESLSTNPNIPSSVATRISTIDSGVLKRNLASNPATPAETIRMLLAEAEGFAEAHTELSNGLRVMSADSTHDSTIREKIAENPNAPRDLLMELSRSDTTIELLVNLCNNPNTPQEGIIMIAEREIGSRGSQQDWPKALLDNPLLPPSYYERLADTTSAPIRRLIRDCPRTPESLRIRLSYDPELAKGDRYYPEPKKPRFPEMDEPKSIIEIYSLSQEGTDRALAASAPNVPYGILERLSIDKSATVRVAVASNKYAGEDLLLRLCGDVDEKVRMAVASNPSITQTVIEMLLQDASENVIKQIAKREDISTELLAAFATSDSGDLRYAVADNKSLPYDIAISLITDSSARVRNKVAKRNDLKESDYEYLMNYELGHSGNSEETTQPVRKPNLGIVKTLMERIRLTSELQEELSKIGDRDIKSNIVKRADAPLSVVMRLAEDRDYLVRQAAADSPLLPEETAEKLAGDKEVVRIALAENPHTSKALLRKLADDEYEYVRRRAIQNPNIDNELLLERAASDIEWERSSAVNNPTLPNGVLESLSKDESEKVREAAASSPRISEDALRSLSEDQSEKVRARAAKSKRLSVETLLKLAKDESIRVTGSLIARDDLPEQVLREIVRNKPIYAITLYLRYGTTFGGDLCEAIDKLEDTRILIKLAECEELPEAIMMRLLEFDNYNIRAGLVRNPNMPFVKSIPQPEPEYGFGSVYDDDIPF